MLHPGDWQALALTLKLAGVSTLVLLMVGTPVAWWLATTQKKFRPFIDAIVALPLVLPPTVLGFYLLIFLGPDGPAGRLMELLGMGPLVFTFAGLVLGSVVYSLPFVVQPLRDAFIAVGPEPLEAAATLGANPWKRFRHVAVPMAKRGFFTAASLGFAHTMGEFGVVLMLGGNIPGQTRVVSIAIFDHVEALNYSRAHTLAAVLLILSFTLLLAVQLLNRHSARRVR
ncbi:MAG: molybdate ABC transporter permease subunit [bacterium]|nr:molybdate ABC transporter permease subunit [bacterium]